jgi:hypothetical protein
VGRFPNRHGYHAALFMEFGARGMSSGEYTNIVVMDQWIGRDGDRVQQRDIATYTEVKSRRQRIKPSDNAGEFYVVMV